MVRRGKHKPRSRSAEPSHSASVAPSSSLHGRVALITGATQGIGLATARELAAEGCNLILCGRDRKRLAAAEAQLSHKGVKVVAISCDVRDEKSVAAMFTAVGA